tara:strand:- start:194 stop:835 length:642 start_codon:yes stop_codon:yes gene_type:complete
MEGAEIPTGFIDLNNLPPGKLILEGPVKRLKNLFIFAFLAIMIFYLMGVLMGIYVVIIFSLCLFVMFMIEYLNKKKITTYIAVNLGHPWVEEEHDIDMAEVSFLTSSGWEVLPQKGRVRENKEEQELILDDNESEVSFGFVPQNLRSELIIWLNYALAIRDAQNEMDDEIEKARSREDLEDTLDVERMWPELKPGELSIKPGAIFRKFSKGKK